MTYTLDQIKALRAENERFRDQLVIMRGEFEQLKSEVLEQARLLGISGSNEAKLRGEVERLNRMLDKWMAEHEPAVLRMGMEIERLKALLEPADRMAEIMFEMQKIVGRRTMSIEFAEAYRALREKIS